MLGNFDIHNPGNIRKSSDLFKGEVRPSSNAHFKEFISNEYGYRAMFRILSNYLYSGYKTIFSIIARWAPAFDNNNTAAYIQFVSSKMKMAPNILFSSATLPQLVYYMTWYENSFPGDRDEINRGYALFVGGNTKNKPSTNQPKEHRPESILLAGLMIFLFIKIL